ncbi:sugar phosphate isomerase/epimerase family protein [Flavisolibacter nicotianae]|uniref:sugar phosphate isomerase/epimerase family protein n=1 Tax=Flavisolibacter nicotianae TaxID=2364882 RepID=UPI000EB0A3A6|nr:sugar phosphate isomerase/epimerase family protein [Flavisolibacter nicotianae]
MNPISRKQFLQNSSFFLAALAAGPVLGFSRKPEPVLAFSTLGCPDWSFQQITDFAAQHGYKGIEVRGIRRQMDLPLCEEFRSEEARKKTLAIMKQKGLLFVNLGSSTTLHFREGTERQKNLADGKRFIDLANQLDCPYVRVFPNNFPKEQEKNETIDLISKGLLELGDYARDKKVTVLLETHGDAVRVDDLVTIMQAAKHSNVGLIWDVANMWTITKEPPDEAYRQLKNYIRHTHIKDAKLIDGKIQYTFLGEGDVPIFEAIDALAKGGYKGHYSFEWEKLWHPEIAEPEIAFADYPVKMKNHFNSR